MAACPQLITVQTLAAVQMNLIEISNLSRVAAVCHPQRNETKRRRMDPATGAGTRDLAILYKSSALWKCGK